MVRECPIKEYPVKNSEFGDFVTVNSHDELINKWNLPISFLEPADQ